MSVHFPNGFLWGAATSAYQIEGAAQDDGRGPSIWDTFAHTPGKIFHNDTGNIAADHYHRLEADLDLMAELGLQGYRFSVSWSRVQPAGRGRINQRGIDFYQRLVDGLCQRSITPMLTLYHWDLPQALQDLGGWEKRATADYFAEYAAIIYQALGDRVPFWITLNEPWCSAFVGHAEGKHAPGMKNEAAALAVTHHLLLGHGKAVQALRASGANNGVGITLSLSASAPATEQEADQAATHIIDGIENRLYLDPLFRGQYPEDMVEHFKPVSNFAFVHDGDMDIITAPFDFLGVNYYLRHTVRADVAHPERGAIIVQPTGNITAGKIGVSPCGLTEVLLRLKHEYTQLPIYITENGAAFYDYVTPEKEVNDGERLAFLDGHFRAAHEAITQGVDLRGYFVWSLFDTFEWADGYSIRFGIVYIDYISQMRIPKRSALWYREVIRYNGLQE